MTQKPTTPDKDDDTGILEEILSEEKAIPHKQETQDNLLSGFNQYSQNGQNNPEITDIINLLKNPYLAMLILDKNLTVIYSTPKTASLFNNYYTFSRKPFFNIFNKTLEQSEMKNFLSSLRSKEDGYSWSGTLKHKTPTTQTLHTHTNIIPFFSKTHTIAGFQVFFEDITHTYQYQIRTTFKSILEASKLKDNDTGLHNERVSYYCKKMAEYLYASKKYPQIDLDFIENIGFLAAMHDVGKIGTPDSILQKPGKLTDQEWEIMREHTINGAFILSSYPVPMAKEVALSHHEWWNGTGYPYKLEEEMIPLTARIVTIADVYDALRMKRSYKDEFSHEEAYQKIVSASGTHFDPNLIRLFEQIHQDFNDIWDLLRDTEPPLRDNRDRSKEFSEVV